MYSTQKVLIISPNLEREYCGVSDYVYVLKSLLENNGHTCSLLALSDKFCTKLIDEPNCFRIPFSTNSKIKIKHANIFISEYEPDIIYFNLVSYGYNRKGLPFYLLNFLPQISKKYKVVIIAHELWAGNFKTESFKNKFLGNVQRLLFAPLLKKIEEPTIVVTTVLALNILKKLGINSHLIPVFSNIPIEDIPVVSVPNPVIRLILFGSSLFRIDYDLLIKFIERLIEIYNKRIQIDIVGLNNYAIEDWENIKQYFTLDKLVIINHGFSSAQKISQLMQEAQIGITTYMPFFWSKSGSIAAMLVHGLPIVSIAKQEQIDKFTESFFHNPRIFTISYLQDKDYMNELTIEKINFNYNRNIFNKLIALTPNFKLDDYEL